MISKDKQFTDESIPIIEQNQNVEMTEDNDDASNDDASKEFYKNWLKENKSVKYSFIF